MTRVLVTGGSGFLGSALARDLLSGPVRVGGDPARPVDRLVLADVAPPPADLAADERVEVLTGDLAHTVGDVADVDLVLHLAGVVSSAAEADFDLGMRVNLDHTRFLLEWGRAHARPPVLVFTSSLAVFGRDPHAGLPAVVDDDTLPRPQSSYGAAKLVAEHLVAEYSRRGFVRGRSVRLMTVAGRPGAANAAASSFLSSMIREPVAGTSTVCPVPADLPVALSSPSRTLQGVRRAAEVDDVTWGSSTAMNLPALTTTPAEMCAALDRVVGEGTSELVSWVPDPEVISIVGSWPGRFETPRARALGLGAVADFDDVVREYLAARPAP